MSSCYPQVAGELHSGPRMVDNTISDIIALGGGYREYNQELLFYFLPEIRRIAEAVLADPECAEECELLGITRQCYRQAMASDGALNCARYFCPFNESTADRASAQSAERTEIVEHGIALNIESLRVGLHSIGRQETEGRQRTQQMWIGLWTEILRNSPGPILFDPPASPLFSSFDFHLDEIPRYLFRTFDPKSFGRSNEEVMASPASESRTVNSRIDILSQDGDYAMSVVDRHMNPWRVKDYASQQPDNLVSWTSSLLYAIQYAFYRRYHHGCTAKNVKICVVDTQDFTRGQFIHAKRLLQAYYGLVKRADLRQYFDLRLLVYIYQNGEYLSQGLINHRGRSRVISLAQLEESGLYSLYPEFADGHRHTKWAVTTAYLRQLWTVEQITTYEEIKRAIKLARNCFAGFRVLDIVVILLCFKERFIERRVTDNDLVSDLEPLVPEWGRKPQEVQQYLIASQVLQSLPRIAIGDALEETDEKILQALCSCFQVRTTEHLRGTTLLPAEK
ncbi:uncharacterized protein KD926_007398 [Aspergillus affinis]|uniref:uncharacterized protein n=1 Tax=Aspergillus affinis TaxID=1070780 RepID=UPI0022FDD760|nr:uncharacterized protein KD926_007398 [Aspergillus affinis]KAI9041128.1 hypothetical protein KD926_007398 [Aspergillus affinis]